MNPDDLLDSQLNVRCSTAMRAEVEKYTSTLAPKPADIARTLIEFGLLAAKAHGLHTLLGVIERKAPIVLAPATIAELYAPIEAVKGKTEAHPVRLKPGARAAKEERPAKTGTAG